MICLLFIKSKDNNIEVYFWNMETKITSVDIIINYNKEMYIYYV